MIAVAIKIDQQFASASTMMWLLCSQSVNFHYTEDMKILLYTVSISSRFRVRVTRMKFSRVDWLRQPTNALDSLCYYHANYLDRDRIARRTTACENFCATALYSKDLIGWLHGQFVKQGNRREESPLKLRLNFLTPLTRVVWFQSSQDLIMLFMKSRHITPEFPPVHRSPSVSHAGANQQFPPHRNGNSCRLCSFSHKKNLPYPCDWNRDAVSGWSKAAQLTCVARNRITQPDLTLEILLRSMTRDELLAPTSRMSQRASTGEPSSRAEGGGGAVTARLRGPAVGLLTETANVEGMTTTATRPSSEKIQRKFPPPTAKRGRRSVIGYPRGKCQIKADRAIARCRHWCSMARTQMSHVERLFSCSLLMNRPSNPRCDLWLGWWWWWGRGWTPRWT